MDEYIKLSIKGRKDIFTNNYEIKDKDILEKIDNLFKKIEDLGKTCSNATDFENKFQSSPLNKEYNDLVTEVTQKCKFIYQDEYMNSYNEDLKEKAKEDLKSDVKYLAKDLTMPARRKAREAFDSKMRDTPLGTIEQISNMKNLFNRFRKK